MLDIVTFKWSNPGYRSKFTGEHVNIMANMCARHYRSPFRFSCVTDDPSGIDQRKVRVIGLWDTYSLMSSPHGRGNPSCYRRLELWNPARRNQFGPRILQIDLDMVLVADVTSLWDRPEDVVMWKDALNPSTPYNGAMQLFSPATRPQVWRDFDPINSPRLARERGYFGSDQAWLSLALGPDEAKWTADDGALSWRVHVRKTPIGYAHIPFEQARCAATLPDGAKIVNFHGIDDPWAIAELVPWIAENYR